MIGRNDKWTAGVATAAVIAVLAIPAMVMAQREAPAEARPAFEVATVKPAAPDAPAATLNRVMLYSPNRLTIPNMTLTGLIYNAYGDGGFNTSMRVTGGPDWTNRTAFAIEGVASGKATPRQLRLMLQRFLEERFALKVRTEMETVDLLALVLERSDGMLGPNVKAWNGTCRTGTPSEEDDPGRPRCQSGYRSGGVLLDGATMFSVAEILSLPQSRSLLGKIVDDQTGLKGRYTLDMDYPFGPQRPADPAAPADLGPSLLVHRRSGAMGTAAGSGPGAVQTRRSRKRAAADGELTGLSREAAADCGPRRSLGWVSFFGTEPRSGERVASNLSHGAHS